MGPIIYVKGKVGDYVFIYSQRLLNNHYMLNFLMRDTDYLLVYGK